jgi:predicted nuclease of predicted toxin-antitoxin system
LKLLFDHNISHKLVPRLADLFPDSTQTRLLNLSRTNDSQLWLIAKTHGFVFVTKDKDVAELAILRGAPPKILWLRMGNCKTAVIERVLRFNFRAIESFVANPEQVVLELFD